MTVLAVQPARRPRRAWAWLGSAAFLRLASVVVVLAVWQWYGLDHKYAVSYPTAIAEAAWHTTAGQVLPAFGATMGTFWLGFAICVVVGVPLGLLTARSRVLATALNPYLTILYSMPYVALFPVFILIFGIQGKLALSIVLVGGLVPIVVNSAQGGKMVPASLLDVGKSHVAGPTRTFRAIMLPGSLDYIFAGIRIGFSRALIATVIIEIETSTNGIGHLLSSDTQGLQMNLYFVPLIYLGLVSIICAWLFQVLHRWFAQPWARNPALARQWEALKDLLPEFSRARAASAPSRLAGPPGFLRKANGWLGGSRAGRSVVRLIALAIVLLAWQLYANDVGATVLPGPGPTLSALWQQAVTGHSIYAPLASSCLVLVAAFAIALAVGIPAGIWMGRSKRFESVADPWVSFLYALPHAALIPLFVVLVGYGFNMRLLYAVLSAVFIVVINTMAGVKAIDRELFAAAESFCAGRWLVLRAIILPGASVFIMSGARIAFSATWIGVITAEILSSQTGLGGDLTNYANYYETANMFVPIIAIIVVSLAILGITAWLEPRLTPWLRTQPPRTARRALKAAEEREPAGLAA